MFMYLVYVLAVSVGFIAGMWCFGYLSQKMVVKETKPKHKGPVEGKLSARFTDQQDGFTDSVMEDMTEEEKQEYSEAERKTQTYSYDYAERKAE